MAEVIKMGNHDNDVIGKKICGCGCGKTIYIKKWHLHPTKSIPTFIKGHQQYGNKRGWKGGERKDVNGYILVYAPTHPNRNSQGKGYVKRSRLIMEKKIGRYLSKNEVVHHINGIRDDDREENLVLTTKWDHQPKYHKRKHLRDKWGRFIKKGENKNDR